MTRGSAFNVFPVAAACTALGVGALAFASRQAAPPSAAPVLEPVLAVSAPVE